MNTELRYIRGLLIHIGFMIGTIALFLISRDFKPTDLIYMAMTAIHIFGVFLISMAANFGGKRE